MYKIYIKFTPFGDWQFKGVARNLEIANKVCNIYNSYGCYTKKVEVDKSDVA